ncbi:hypothetical protein Cgig2_032649 [Carnegiea gigantea]|uniref:Uncharacterized protein n=1 Tax=Carnegiea gigantea TaxID=171969 RepID=A0A9Q1GQB1_9CARY|nr:hypothetical protein Cgig2_032649 [Carnegiea gigantea]
MILNPNLATEGPEIWRLPGRPRMSKCAGGNNFGLSSDNLIKGVNAAKNLGSMNISPLFRQGQEHLWIFQLWFLKLSKIRFAEDCDRVIFSGSMQQQSRLIICYFHSMRREFASFLTYCHTRTVEVRPQRSEDNIRSRRSHAPHSRRCSSSRAQDMHESSRRIAQMAKKRCKACQQLGILTQITGSTGELGLGPYPETQPSSWAKTRSSPPDWILTAMPA